MIKDIFLPERVGSYYLFTKRILAIEICKNCVNGTLVRVQGATRMVEQCEQERIDINHGSSAERTTAALAALLKKFKKFDELRVALSSSFAVFKELRLPFADREKMALVINFEVEPLLPFPLHTAIIDFIITGSSPDGGSLALVAAVQKQHIAHTIALFQAAQAMPTVITIDFFALYDLYMQIPSYRALDRTVLIDLELQNTRIALIEQGKLRQIRTISQGVSHLAKIMGESLHMPPQQAFEQLIRFGVQKEDDLAYTDITTIAFDTFWKEVQFTLSFLQPGSDTVKSYNILLLGDGANIKGIAEHITHIQKTSCLLFDPTQITKDGGTSLGSSLHTIPLSHAISAGAALTTTTEQFNLQAEEFDAGDNTILVKQLLVALILIASLFGILITHYVVQTRTLKKEVQFSSKEALDALKERFKDIDEGERNLTEDVIETAQDELMREEDTWFKFSPQARPTFLKLLLEITDRIDKESLGLSLDQLIITEGTITLKGKVKDYEALKLLEKEIGQSKLLALMPPAPQEPEFTMRLRVIPPARGGQ